MPMPVRRSFLAALLVTASVSAFDATKQEPTFQRTTEVVTGRVIDATTGAPVADARVTLTRYQFGRPASSATPVAPPPTAVTSADGTFTLRDVSPGQYHF